MHYFEFVTKDTTLYQVSKSLNSGLDEILEIRKDRGSDASTIRVSRVLIKFDLTDISSSISNGTISNPKYYLNLYDAGSEELNVEQTLYGYPVSQSWDMGSGRLDSAPIIEDGVSWNYKDDNDTATSWTGSYTTLAGDSYASGTLIVNEGDYANQEFNIGGVDFTFVSGSTAVFNDSSTQIFVTSGSTTGSSVANLESAINDNSSLHGLPIVVEASGSDPAYLILSGSIAGTIANLSAGSSSVVFEFSGDKTKALENGTDLAVTLPPGGGTWYTGSGYEASQSFTNEPTDVRMDVTDIVNKWVDSTVPNEGFILKRSGSVGNLDTTVEEGNNTHYGNFKFFSRETHTVFQPKLEVEWDDSTWTTGSLSALSNTDVEDMILYMKGVRPEYKEESKAKFRVVGRERYPVKTFSTSSEYLTVKTLPSGSTYYSIRDAHTEDVIIPFGDSSKVSCDSTGNYFNVWMNGLQAERFYRILYKVVSGSGVNETIQYFDEDWSFKVSR